MQKVPYTSHNRCMCLWARHFRFYFTPRCGFFSPFPHGTCSLSVRVGCKLRGWFPVLPTIKSLYLFLFRMVIHTVFIGKEYRAFTFFGTLFKEFLLALWMKKMLASVSFATTSDISVDFLHEILRWFTSLTYVSKFIYMNWSFLIRGPIVHIWLLASNGLSWRVPPLYPYTP